MKGNTEIVLFFACSLDMVYITDEKRRWVKQIFPSCYDTVTLQHWIYIYIYTYIYVCIFPNSIPSYKNIMTAGDQTPSEHLSPPPSVITSPLSSSLKNVKLRPGLPGIITQTTEALSGNLDGFHAARMCSVWVNIPEIKSSLSFQWLSLCDV